MSDNYEELLKLIVEKSKKSEEEINEMIESKKKKFPVKVSQNGLLHIIANELGVDLIERIPDVLKIKNIEDSMRNVECYGNVISVYPIREFATGKVGNILIGDETGMIRVVFWNEKTDILEKIKPGDVIHIKSAYSRMNQDRVELQVSRYTEVLINPKGVHVKSVEYEKRKISEISVDDNFVEILGPIVQVYDIKIYERCPKCNKKIENQECAEHGKVEPNNLFIFSFVVDDGTANIRCTFFNDLVEKMIENPLQYKENPIEFSEKRRELIAKMIKVKAKVNYNQSFDRIELNARDFTFEISASEEKEFVSRSNEMTENNDNESENKKDKKNKLDKSDKSDKSEKDTKKTTKNNEKDKKEVEKISLENEDEFDEILEEDEILDDIESLMEE